MIIISALDNSGQQNAAEVLRYLRKQFPDERYIGIGGKALAAAGCELIRDISDCSAMLTGVFGAMKWAVPAYRRLVRAMDAGGVNLVVLVDSPTFNLPLARAAKKRNIKTLYFIAPQTWAWARFRNRKIRKRVDKLAVILPFEEEFFRQAGIDAEFVGHPFIDRLKSTSGKSQPFFAPFSPNILLMPGSRGHVIREVLPAQLRIIKRISEKMGKISVTLAAWPEAEDLILEIIRENGLSVSAGVLSEKADINVFTSHHSSLIQSATLVLAASGTGTLEVAWHSKPVILMYNGSKLLYHLIGRWLIKTKFLSLINILAGRELVPEFMPYIRDESEIAGRAIDMLTTHRKETDAASSQLRPLMDTLYKPNPAKRVSEIAASLIER